MNTGIVAALRGGAAEYTKMASGAAGDNEGRYKSGAAAVKKADAALKKALKSLGQSA